jgi:hypothetical protein
MVSFHSAAVYADARLQFIAAARLACIEDIGGPNQARGYEEILQRMLERHGPLGALALIVAPARDAGVLVGLVAGHAGHDPAELLDQLEMDALSDSLPPRARTDPPALMSCE